MNSQQNKLLAIAAVVLFHGVVITAVLAQHGCKSDGTKPSALDAPAPVASTTPPPVTTPVAANNGFSTPTRPMPEPVMTQVAPAPMPLAQFSEPLITVPTAPVVTAKPAPAPDTTSSMVITYVVVAGENLTSIARKNGITPEELAAANAPKVTMTTLLRPGMTLNIPNHKPSPTAAAPVVADGVSTYKAVAGDSLSKIAVKFHTTSKALMEVNNLKTDTILAGQVLKLPAATATAPLSTSPAGSAQGADENTYKVQSGDTIDKIARNLHISSADLMSLNGLTSQTALNIRPGRILKLPSGTHAPASTPATPSGSSNSTPPPVTIHATSATSGPPPVTTSVTSSGTDAPPLTPVR